MNGHNLSELKGLENLDKMRWWILILQLQKKYQ